jgi:glycerophosphoryl diester phosphodiesterase
MRRALWLLGVLLCAATAALAADFDLQGHRGARALAPENTLAGFTRALSIGVSTLELDVVLSADGVPVVAHDLAPNPDITRNRQGRWLQSAGTPFVRQTWREIRQWDVGRINPASRYARDFPDQQPVDGARMPSLAEVYRLVKRLGADHVQLSIETKIDPRRPQASSDPRRLVQAVLQVTRQHGMLERTRIQSFDWRTLDVARRLEPSWPRVYLTARLPRFDTLAGTAWTAGRRLSDHDSVPALVRAAGGRIWSPHHTDLDQGSLAEARELGLRVIPWTVNEMADMERLIDQGVDGLITDRPDRLRQVMSQRGMVLPPPVLPTTALSSVPP